MGLKEACSDSYVVTNHMMKKHVEEVRRTLRYVAVRLAFVMCIFTADES